MGRQLLVLLFGILICSLVGGGGGGEGRERSQKGGGVSSRAFLNLEVWLGGCSNTSVSFFVVTLSSLLRVPCRRAKKEEQVKRRCIKTKPRESACIVLLEDVLKCSDEILGFGGMR